jgi:hypothetical protein
MALAVYWRLLVLALRVFAGSVFLMSLLGWVRL